MSGADVALPPGYRLIAFDTIGSTNDEAKNLARTGAPNGTVVWAREQTAGRGRRGRTWHSPLGNLYMSLIVRPGGSAARAAQLSFVAALAMADAVCEIAGAALPLTCKWPNDLLLGGRKFSGILLESETGTGDEIDFVIIGVGVNLASKPDGVEYPATSLADHGTAGVSPATLLASFAGYFDSWERRWQREGFGPVRVAWLARAGGVGEEIRVRLERETFHGRFLDLDDDGALVIEGADGRRRVTAGDVFPINAAPTSSVLRDAGSARSSG